MWYRGKDNFIIHNILGRNDQLILILLIMANQKFVFQIQAKLIKVIIQRMNNQNILPELSYIFLNNVFNSF